MQKLTMYFAGWAKFTVKYSYIHSTHSRLTISTFKTEYQRLVGREDRFFFFGVIVYAVKLNLQSIAICSRLDVTVVACSRTWQIDFSSRSLRYSCFGYATVSGIDMSERVSSYRKYSRFVRVQLLLGGCLHDPTISRIYTTCVAGLVVFTGCSQIFVILNFYYDYRTNLSMVIKCLGRAAVGAAVVMKVQVSRKCVFLQIFSPRS